MNAVNKLSTKLIQIFRKTGFRRDRNKDKPYLEKLEKTESRPDP